MYSLINFNINYVDDRFAKTLTKIYSKIFFEYTKNLKERASLPINIILEEAHRYVQNDNDINVIGYNIFDRITKEGRKYGVILGLITQRPSELSNTALSQCSNYIVLRMFHPDDIQIVKNITSIKEKVYHTEIEGDPKNYKIVIKVQNTSFPMNLDFLIDTYFENPILLAANITHKNTLVPNLKYFYYIDLEDYELNEENLFEIIFGNTEEYANLDGVNALSVNVTKDIAEIEFKNFTRARAALESSNLYIPFKRKSMSFRYFIIKIVYLSLSYHEITLNRLPRVQKILLTKDKFEENIYSIENIEISSKMPRLILMEYEDQLIMDYNLIFKFPMDNIAPFTKDNLINSSSIIKYGISGSGK